MDMDVSLPKSPAELAELKEQLHAALAGRFEGLEIDTPQHWALAPFENPAPFFENLSLILPPGSILYLEGVLISSAANHFYTTHRAQAAVAVARDTFFPVPEFFHINYRPEIASGILQLLQEQKPLAAFNHIKGYHQGSLIFTLHDGLGQVLRITHRIPEASITAFAQALGVEYQLQPTKPRDLRQIELFLKMLENKYQSEKVFAFMASGQPGPVRIPSKPWWARLWDKFRS